MLITPFQFLWIVIAVSTIARLAFALRGRRQRGALHDLARHWQMHYSRNDRFDLAPRVAERFPVPGAADFHVLDLIYGSDGDHYRYVFTAEYTVGVTRAHHRRRQVVMFREPKQRDTSGTDPVQLNLADESISLFEQYQAMGKSMKDEA